jgi:hypothetical protein
MIPDFIVRVGQIHTCIPILCRIILREKHSFPSFSAQPRDSGHFPVPAVGALAAPSICSAEFCCHIFL